LRTTDDNWTIIDFEGEPAKSLDERRTRSSPLRDVAGMLRSFSYARAVAEQDLAEGERDISMARANLRDWEMQASEAFVNGYRTTLDSLALNSGQPLVPRSDAAFDSALAAWEADKALYEVAYEARNRPGWIGIPLRALVPELFDQA
jgi:maltose alpha-D-glucosyltransferase/alpha-amylase